MCVRMVLISLPMAIAGDLPSIVFGNTETLMPGVAGRQSGFPQAPSSHCRSNAEMMATRPVSESYMPQVISE